MAVPKRRKSRSNTRKRRTHYHRGLKRPELTEYEHRGRVYLVPPHLVPAFRRGLLDVEDFAD
jgi:large subunit ribosomal protein L32